MNQIFTLYNQLLEETKPILGRTHGLQVLHKGKNIDENSILFVGRENRGHGNKIDNFKEPINSFVENDFGWLNDSYKYTGSPFWRVIGKSLSKISGEKYDINIFEKVYWTNIFKVSPSARKPNTKKARRIQMNICRDLLLEEIIFLKPKGVVFLTDYWVMDYLKKWEEDKIITQIETDSDLKYFNLEFEFMIDNLRIPAIVLPHPQNKKSGAKEHILVEHISTSLN